MARRSESGVNKSQVIRDALKANPDKGPKDIAAMLQAQGLAVNAGYVSVVKGGMKRKARKGRPGRRPGSGKVVVRRGRPGRKPAASGMSSLTAAIEFVRNAGGIEAAKQALASIEEIRKLS